MKRPILLVNDDDAIRASLARQLDAAGFDVAEATDGRAALVALHEHAPCWVLLDLDLPVLDGFEFLRSLRNVPFPPRVFVVSNLDHTSARERARRLGAEQFFTHEQALHPNFAGALREALGLPARDPESNTDTVVAA